MDEKSPKKAQNPVISYLAYTTLGGNSKPHFESFVIHCIVKQKRLENNKCLQSKCPENKKMLANKKAWTTIIAKIDEKWGRGHFRASFNSKAHPDPNRRSYGKRTP